jgi:hypothetical protein
MLTSLLNTFLVNTTAKLNSQLSELKELRRLVQESSTYQAELGCPGGQEAHFSSPDLLNGDAAHAS